MTNLSTEVMLISTTLYLNRNFQNDTKLLIEKKTDHRTTSIEVASKRRSFIAATYRASNAPTSNAFAFAFVVNVVVVDVVIDDDDDDDTVAVAVDDEMFDIASTLVALFESLLCRFA